MAETALQSAKDMVGSREQPQSAAPTLQGSALPWEKIEAKKEYQDLIPENKAAAKQQYFDMVVAPQLPETEHATARSQFIDYTKRLENRRQRPGFVRQMFLNSLDLTKRGLGIGMGVFAAVPAFGLGGMTERHLDKEKFDAMPVWEQILVSFEGAFKSAGRAVAQPGDWGTQFDDYVKARTGKTIEEHLPAGLKWAAPTVEFLASLPFDPLIVLGGGAWKIGSKVPNHWQGKIPDNVLAELSRMEALEASEKVALQQSFADILSNRAKYMEKWQETVAFTGGQHKTAVTEVLRKRGLKSDLPLIKPGDSFSKMTAPRQAMAGQPKVDFSALIEREVPELTEMVLEAKRLGKIPKGTSVKGVAAEELINNFRKSKGWGPISKVPKQQLVELKRADTLDKLNKFRAEQGLPVYESTSFKPTKKVGFQVPEKREVQSLAVRAEDEFAGGSTHIQAEQSLSTEMQKKIARGTVVAEDGFMVGSDAAGKGSVFMTRQEVQKRLGLSAKEDIDAVNLIGRKFPTTIKARAIIGSIAGVEEDENGNITYNLKAGLAGSLAVATGMTVLNMKRVQKFTQTLMDNPAWAKVHGTVGKTSKSFSMAGIASRINVGLFDRLARLKPVSPKAYAAARAFAAHKDQALVKFNQLKEAFKPVADDEVVLTDYINAKRMLSRAKAGIKNPDGVTREDALKAIREIEEYYASTGQDVVKLKKAFKDFQTWAHDHILKEALDSGVISKEGYKAIKDGNEFYATFEVLDHIPKDSNKIPGVRGEYYTVSGQKVIQKMTGTEKKIADPLEATIKKFTQAQAFFARNKVANIFIDDPATKGLYRPIATSKKDFSILKNKGFDPVMEGSWNKNEFGTVGRMKNGRLEKYLVDKEIADSMRYLTTHQAPRVIQAYNAVFRATATTLSPAFLVRNIFRDAILGYVSSPYHTATRPDRFVRDWGKGAWEAVKHEFGKPSLVDDYINAGGSFGWAGAEVTGDVAKSAAKKQLFKKGAARKAVGVITSPAKLIQKANEVVEMAPRLGTFDRGMILEFPIEDAAMAGRQATIDFNKGGVWAKVANQYIPFLNARIGAKVTLFEAFKRDPGGTSAKLMTTAMLPGLAGYAMNRLYFDDEYDDIPEYIRQDNFVLIYGTETNDDGKTVPKYLAIPKGDAGTLFNPFEYALDQKIKEDPQGVKEFLINFLSDISPIEFAREGQLSGTKLASSLLPPLAKGVVEDWANLNFYKGQEIVPHYMGKTKPPELQYKENTPESFKWLGGKLEIAPLRLQNFASNVLTGYGREGLNPEAMIRGIKGALVKTTSGEIERQAWTTIKDIEQGYLYIRAYANEMVKEGDVGGATNIIQQWNNGIKEQVQAFNDKFGEHGITDKGGITKSYTFTRRKLALMIRSTRKNEVDKRSPLQKKLSVR